MKRLGNIIMADDNGNDVSLVSYAFREAGLDNPIQWLADGNLLIRHLKHEKSLQQMPLLLVIDWKIPGTNTLEVLKWIRSQPEYLSLLIVVLTGSGNPVEKQLAYDAGTNWHIVKTAKFADLTQLVHRIQEFWFCVKSPKRSQELATS
jgi:CheY-like chemotaxis protein